MMTVTEYLDPKVFYAESLDSWEDLWNRELTIFQNLKNIVSSAVFLPDSEIQIPVAIAYLMTSQKWAKILPLMLCYGREGTGKSTLTKLASHLRSSEILGQSSTFASIRNELNNSRWLDEECEFEKDGATLLFDNVYCSTFTQNPQLLALILSGYDKSSDKLMIASAMGENIIFRTFSSKIISSVEPLWLDAKLKELSRRLLIIRHQRIEDLGAIDLEGKIDLDSISWDGFSSIYFDFWSSKTNVERYVNTRKMLTRRGKKPFTIPDTLSSNIWAISIDLIATGISVGAWMEPQESIDHLSEFFKLQTEKLAASESSILTFLRWFINREVGSIPEMNRRLKELGEPEVSMKIDPRRLREFLLEKERDCLLDVKVDNITEAHNMFLLGWKKTDQGWEPIS
jgi:hypothetical protein